MPIRFFCEHCRQMLKIGTSKMGSVVDCPRCHKSVVVPPQSTPQAEQLYHMLKRKRSEETITPRVEDHHSLAEPNAPESAWDELGGNVNEDDLNRWIDELWTNSPDKQGDSFSAFLPPPVPNAVADDTIALFNLQKRHKNTLTLLYVLTTVAFVLGIIFGISAYALLQPSRPNQYTAEKNVEVNEIAGTLYYLNESGERQVDTDAVIICLPKDRLPSPLFSWQGLRPGEIPKHDSIQLIQELGGMYERTDAHGSFTLPYREGVRYVVIFISAHQIQSGGVLKPGFLQELRRYFSDSELLNESRLQTDEYEWSGGKHSLRHTFEFVE